MKVINSLVFSCCAMLILPGVDPLLGQQDQFARIESIDQFQGLASRWRDAMESVGAPSIAVAVVQDGRILALDAFGERNLEGEPATVDTMYYIASATKPFVAMTTLMLHDEGKLDIDQPVQQYLPQFQLADAKRAKAITVRDLLCHAPGLRDFRIVWRDAYTGQINDEHYYRLLSTIDPASQVDYSNIHYTLLGRIIESVTGRSWKHVVEEKIFAPTNMRRTTAFASRMYRDKNFAQPMVLLDEKWQLSPLRKTDRTMHAAGGLGTTARDSANWLLLNLQRGQLGSQRLLSEELSDEMLSMQAKYPEKRGQIRQIAGFAIGWQMGNYRGKYAPMYIHGGGYVGAGAYYAFIPEQDVGVAVLTNAGRSGNAVISVVMIDLLDRLLGIQTEPEQDLLPQYKSLSQRMRKKPEMKRPGGNNPAANGEYLTLDPKQYVGTYQSEGWGKAEIELGADQLKVRVGDVDIQIFAKGLDTFRYWIAPGMDGLGEFVLKDGKVKAVEFELQAGAARFERVAK